MSDSIRTALERLVELDGLPDSWSPAGIQAWDDAIAAGKAALAEQRGEGPSDEELAAARLHQPTLSADDIPPGPFSEHELREQWNQQADKFNQWDSLDSYEQLAWAQARAIQRDRNARPTPPAEGEVAQLVAWLRENAEDERQMCESSNRASLNLERAAELLQRQHPAPVPVSERLPGDQLCWWYEPDEEDGYGGRWTLLRIRGGTGAYTHWLPAHALPLPQGEVEK